jgi:hypothetical protein
VLGISPALGHDFTSADEHFQARCPAFRPPLRH